MKHQMQIGVAGAADATDDLYQLAWDVGFHIGSRGAVLVCGGRYGVMEAAASGAASVKGRTIGVLPGIDPNEANRYIETVICTGLGQARNFVFVLSTDVLIAIGGEYGTLSEIAIALKHRIPVVGLRTWEIADFTRDPLFTTASEPQQTVETAFSLARSHGRRSRNVSRND